jgi:predicted ATP-grasp superfamily ATP-dependent carboligase
MIKKHIASDLSDPETYFYISLLTDRFQVLNERWSEALSQRFGKKFEPIYVLCNEHKESFREANYIVINDSIPEFQEQFPSENIINVIYPEDLNDQTRNSKDLQGIIAQLIKKQGTVYVLSFTNARLDFNNPHVKLLGPKPTVVEKYDSKVEQMKLFEELGMLRHTVDFYANFDDFSTRHTTFPYYVAAAYTSGGIGGAIAKSREDLINYRKALRPSDVRNPFVVSHIIKNIVKQPNVSAMVCGENDTRIIAITDQILRDNRYLGNVYPSSVSSFQQDEIRALTKKVGSQLAKEGFRGLFGMDYLINDKGVIHPVDLNPRRQGGYLCHTLMSQRVDLITQELKLALGEPVDSFSEADCSCSMAWAHSKLSPYGRFLWLAQEYSNSSPESVFKQYGEHCATYYPKDSVFVLGSPGVYMVSRKTPAQAREVLDARSEALIADLYAPLD